MTLTFCVGYQRRLLPRRSDASLEALTVSLRRRNLSVG